MNSTMNSGNLATFFVTSSLCFRFNHTIFFSFFLFFARTQLCIFSPNPSYNPPSCFKFSFVVGISDTRTPIAGIKNIDRCHANMSLSRFVVSLSNFSHENRQLTQSQKRCSILEMYLFSEMLLKWGSLKLIPILFLDQESQVKIQRQKSYTSEQNH